MRAIPAQFQNRDDASSATPTKAPPIPAGLAPTPILRNWPSKVPTFSKMLAASETAGTTSPRSPSAATILFTLDILLRARGLADHAESAALSSRAIGSRRTGRVEFPGWIRR